MKLTKITLALALIVSAPTMAAKFNAISAPAAQGQLGSVVVNPYGTSPQTAIVDLGGYEVNWAKVVVHGKDKDGVDIKYDVSRETILDHNGIPIFGLYADFDNKVTLTYKKNGKHVIEDYSIYTQPRTGGASVNGMKLNFPKVTPIKVDEKFKDRLYLINYIMPVEGSTAVTWTGGMGALEWDRHPVTFITDTQGETRWSLDVSDIHDVKHLEKRGIVMGIHQMDNGDIIFGQGMKIFRMTMMGETVFEWNLPRGYQDFSHDMQLMENGNYLVRAAKTSYLREDGLRVHTVRDQILEIDPTGKLVEVWDLNKILDNMRDSHLVALDAGAVCLNIDDEKMGKKAKIEPDAPYGDIPGVGAGRNWAHVNSVEYDPADDSIILSLRHQGNVKIGRDKEVKWILSPREGWTGDLAKKVLQPVNSNGDEIQCTEKGLCEDPSKFDFTYTQHTTWLTGKEEGDDEVSIVSFDNGDGRFYDQPTFPTDKYSRGVEFLINEDDMTVEQRWQYGQERGFEWYSVVTSNISYEKDRDTMFMYSANTKMSEPKELTVGILNEVRDGTHDVKVELHVTSPMPRSTGYRAVIIDPNKTIK
ncbi:aryl-sulfate sulfotransferase [Shewanella marina]|uniref:aryl-sulfate sulfotransferase n=1 Tax=Shewanella marina TaxID=487319 RepID=UPI00046F09C5|nr:aryl-sulfate sulfotransferase [Shewanella marina]